MDGNYEHRGVGGPIGGQFEPDAHGQAAMLLLESLCHTLVERGILSPGEILSTVQVAAEVKRDLAESLGESRVRMEQSLALLSAIERSFAAYDGNGVR